MKKHRLLAMMLALMFILAGCNSNKTGSNTGNIPETRVEGASADKEITERSERTVTTATLPKELVRIPEDYFEESEYPGTPVELEYDTYESMTYMAPSGMQIMKEMETYIFWSRRAALTVASTH